MTNEEFNATAAEYKTMRRSLTSLYQKALLDTLMMGLSHSEQVSNDLITALTALKLAEDSANAGR